MRNWDALVGELQLLSAQPCVWSSVVVSADREKLEYLQQYAIRTLLGFLQLPLPDEEKENRLRQFFYMRWVQIGSSSLDYTLNPHLPANQACLKVAGKIAKKDEPICQILMPTLKKVIGSSLDLKSASEDFEGEFLLEHYLINVEGDALMSLSGVFDYARDNTDFLFPTHEENKLLFELSAADRERLRCVAPDYFDALQRMHHVRHGEKPSIGRELRQLQMALIKSSKIGAGTEILAVDAECAQPIIDFHREWIALSPDIRNEIQAYTADAGTLTLYSYLCCLFVNSGKVPFSDADYDRMQKDRIVACTHQIGEQLDIILNQYPDLMNIPLAGREAHFHETQNSVDAVKLNQLSEHFQQSLKNRLPLMGIYDRYSMICQPLVEILLRNYFEPRLLGEDIVQLGNAVRNTQSLATTLLMLPRSRWSLFLASITDYKNNFIGERGVDSTSVFSYLLMCVSSDEWPLLFGAWHAAGWEYPINTYEFELVLDVLPESQWAVLRDAMQAQMHYFIAHEGDVAGLFFGAMVTKWDELYRLFQTRIHEVINTPKALSQFFKVIPQQDWLHLSITLKLLMTMLVKNKNFVHDFLSSFPINIRMMCMKVIAPYLDCLEMGPVVTANLLKMLDMRDWFDLFELLEPKRIALFLKNEIDIAAFLHLFERRMDRITCVYALTGHLLDMNVNAVQLHDLLLQFPECEGALLKLFVRKLPDILSGLMTTFVMHNQFQLKIPDEFKKTFYFFVEKALPLLLTVHVMSKFSEELFLIMELRRDLSTSENKVHIFYRNMVQIEMDEMRGVLSAKAACEKKLKLLCEILQQPLMSGEYNVAAFRDDIARVFGKEFFSRILYFKTHLQEQSGNLQQRRPQPLRHMERQHVQTHPIPIVRVVGGQTLFSPPTLGIMDTLATLRPLNSPRN